MLVVISQLLWGAFLVLWVAMWRQNVSAVSTSIERESTPSRVLHLVMVVIGFALIWTAPHLYTSKPAMAKTVIFDCFGLALEVIALAFAAWARIALGSNWSAPVATGSGQTLVRGGPYAWVRHPIYLGLTLAAVASAIVVGGLKPLFGALLIVAAFERKRRIEENALRRRFGEEYDIYADHVPALLLGRDKRKARHSENERTQKSQEGNSGPQKSDQPAGKQSDAESDSEAGHERRAG